MRAVVASGAGGADSLRLVERPEPVPNPGEVLLDVAATAVNRADLLQRDGNYPPPSGVTDVLGLEAVGTVIAVAADVAGWSPGDRAMALLSGGGYAERVTVPAAHLLPIPARFGWDEAAAIPEVFLTAYLTLVRLAQVQPGERVLIHAAASGVGTAAIQVARARGATVLATSRSARRLEHPAALGATTLVAQEGRFAERVMELTDGHGADVILDLVGAAYWPENAASLARGGRVICTGLVGGRHADIDLGMLLARNVSIIGSTLRGRSSAEKAAIVAGFGDWGLPLLVDGTLRPIVDRVLPLAQVAVAHRHVEANAAVGKVVLRVA